MNYRLEKELSNNLTLVGLHSLYEIVLTFKSDLRKKKKVAIGKFTFSSSFAGEDNCTFNFRLFPNGKHDNLFHLRLN